MSQPDSRGQVSLPTPGSRFPSTGNGRGGLLIAVLCGVLLQGTEAFAQRRKEVDRPRGKRAATTPAEGVSTGSRDDIVGKGSRRGGDESAPFDASQFRDGPLAKLAAYCEESREALADVQDYTAVFSRKELVKRRLVTQKMEMKYRHQPFSVYFHFVSPEEVGREVIYVDGSFKNRLVVHETGLKAIAGTLYLPLNDARVTQESRHPITSVGIHNILQKTIENLEADATDDQVIVKKYPEANLDDQACVAFVIRHP
ncbi:MAG: DUF1571 domain-containing protein, partial [Planctomycetota bacterium]|nr:DUF1571 domain-containing protein [Planctomycetota bacterium]